MAGALRPQVARGWRTRDGSPAPLALLGAVAVTVGLTAWLARPAWRSRAPTQGREALIAYLRDHLSGSDVAIRVVRRLAWGQPSADDGPLFRRLAKEFEEDRAVVRALLTGLGASRRSIKRAAGLASGAVLSLTAGGEPGHLSLVRTLEALSIGVQGKRCMWRALQELHPSSMPHLDFVDMEVKALRQWEAIEERRRDLVTRTFSVTGTRTD
jgi:hypothetical protein